MRPFIGRHMEPPFKKKALKVLIDRAFTARTVAKLIAIGPLQQKIRKHGPFKLPAIKPEYHY